MTMLQRQNAKLRAAVLGAVLLLPVTGLAVWYWLTTRSEADELTRIVRQYGYTAVTPPSRLFGPGTITTVETLPDGTMQLHLACKMDDSTLAAMWQKSPTVDRSLVSAIKQTFESSAKALEMISSGATGRRSRGIDVSLRNINIVTMTYQDLIDVRNQYLKGTCEEVVIGNLRAGAAVCQPEEVLEADLVYKQAVQNGLDANGKAEATEAGGSLKVDQERSDTDEAQGEDLFLGAKVSRGYCFRLAKNGQDLAGSFDRALATAAGTSARAEKK
jgi:hypothetical protein